MLEWLIHIINRYGSGRPRGEYGGLADTAVHGVVMVGKSMFSCRGLFWVLRVVSGFGLSRDCRNGLERMIGGMLDQAKLDDLLISGHHKCTYDVNLVIRLIRVFVNSDGAYSVHKLKKVGKLVDKYLGEISPDQNLKISKFLGVAESLPDCARDCFDGVYRAIDIYLEVGRIRINLINHFLVPFLYILDDMLLNLSSLKLLSHSMIEHCIRAGGLGGLVFNPQCYSYSIR